MEQNQNRNFYRHIFNSVFLLTRFPDHDLKLKALDQPQSAGEESLLTRVITQLFVQRFVLVFHRNRKQLMFFQNTF